MFSTYNESPYYFDVRHPRQGRQASKRVELRRMTIKSALARFNAAPGPFRAELDESSSGASFRVWPVALLGKKGVPMPSSHRERIRSFAASVARESGFRLADDSPQPEADNSFRFELV